MGQARPNILLLLSDEHNATISSCYGNPIVQTPHLQSLADTGITFDGAYCNSPLCGPSRISITSGKYVSQVQAWGNGASLPTNESPSIARIMNGNGYRSYLCGKQHYTRGHRYGFEELGGNFNNYAALERVERRVPGDYSVNTAEAARRFAEFRCGDESEVLDHDRAVTAATVDFLERGSGEPFFLIAGHLAPHFPLIVPQRYHDFYRGRVPLPQWPPGHLDRQPGNYQQLRRGFGVVDVDPEIVRLGRELYYGLTTWYDEQVGEILAALERSPAADNTIVVYTSDHGEHLGEHGLWWKSTMYDCAARVPLIVRFPDRFRGGQRETRACSLVDLVATIAELGGAAIPADWSGDSLLPILRQPSRPWKDLAVSEYYGHFVSSGICMIRVGQYKYVYHTRRGEWPAERELYDLNRDPNEWNNLASNTEFQTLLRSMHVRLCDELKDDPDNIEARVCTYHVEAGTLPADVGGWLPPIEHFARRKTHNATATTTS